MVLEDHLKRGRRFIPPLLTKPIQQSNWRMERLPEMFWLAFVGNRIGDRRVLALAYEMARDVEATIKQLRQNEKAFRAQLPTEHLSCTAAEKQRLLADHGDAVWLREFQPHLADMIAIWPGLPLGYLAPKPAAKSEAIVREIKQQLAQCRERHDTRSLVMQATTVAIELQLGRLTVFEGMTIPDFNAIFDYPKTEESQMAAGFVVTACGQVVLCSAGADRQHDFAWPRAFWNSCYRLEPCEHE